MKRKVYSANKQKAFLARLTRHSGVIRKLLKERGQTCGLSPKLKPHEAGSECCPRRKEDISLYVSNTVNSSADVESSYPEGDQRVYYVQL